LPGNQWELELEHWFKFILADLQRAILDQATGPVTSEARSFHSPPTSAEAQAICGSQKIRSESYTSFNVLGLTIISSIGGQIMVISACLPTATARMQRHKRPFASIEWVTNDTLQLQRLAHEAIGAGRGGGAHATIIRGHGMVIFWVCSTSPTRIILYFKLKQRLRW
jgi:hypothetical protein